jgi:hypothetical protein
VSGSEKSVPNCVLPVMSRFWNFGALSQPASSVAAANAHASSQPARAAPEP